MNENHYDFALLMDHQHVLRSKSDPNLREQKTNETFPKTQQTQDVNPVSGLISTMSFCIKLIINSDKEKTFNLFQGKDIKL